MNKEKDDEEQVQNLMRLMSTNCNVFKRQFVGYISGFVVKMLQKIVKCDTCMYKRYSIEASQSHVGLTKFTALCKQKKVTVYYPK